MKRVFAIVIWNKHTKIVRVLGLNLIVGECGNCITPALHLDIHNANIERTDAQVTSGYADPAQYSLTLRCRIGRSTRFAETVIYSRCSGSVDCHSEHLAENFGTHHEPDTEDPNVPDHHVLDHPVFGYHISC